MQVLAHNLAREQHWERSPKIVVVRFVANCYVHCNSVDCGALQSVPDAATQLAHDVVNPDLSTAQLKNCMHKVFSDIKAESLDLLKDTFAGYISKFANRSMTVHIDAEPLELFTWLTQQRDWVLTLLKREKLSVFQASGDDADTSSHTSDLLEESELTSSV